MRRNLPYTLEMTDAFTVRSATPADAAALVEFNRAMAKETEAKDLALPVLSAGVKWLLKNPQHGFYLVAETGGEVIGSLMVTSEWSDWRNRVFWWIQSVYVKPQYRRKGVYRKLYERVKQLARERGDICGFRLYVEKENLTAQRTYQSLGMQEAHYKMFEELVQG